MALILASGIVLFIIFVVGMVAINKAIKEIEDDSFF